MISFSQLLLLLFVVFLLFGDTRQFLNKVMVLFFNLKTVFKKKFIDSKSPKSK